jgi:hypothetical protein
MGWFDPSSTGSWLFLVLCLVVFFAVILRERESHRRDKRQTAALEQIRENTKGRS